MNICKSKYDEMVKTIDDLSLDNARMQRRLEDALLRVKELEGALRLRVLGEDSLMALNGLANAISQTITKVYGK